MSDSPKPTPKPPPAPDVEAMAPQKAPPNAENITEDRWANLVKALPEGQEIEAVQEPNPEGAKPNIDKATETPEATPAAKPEAKPAEAGAPPKAEPKPEKVVQPDDFAGIDDDDDFSDDEPEVDEFDQFVEGVKALTPEKKRALAEAMGVPATALADVKAKPRPEDDKTIKALLESENETERGLGERMLADAKRNDALQARLERMEERAAASEVEAARKQTIREADYVAKRYEVNGKPVERKHIIKVANWLKANPEAAASMTFVQAFRAQIPGARKANRGNDPATPRGPSAPASGGVPSATIVGPGAASSARAKPTDTPADKTSANGNGRRTVEQGVASRFDRLIGRL